MIRWIIYYRSNPLISLHGAAFHFQYGTSSLMVRFNCWHSSFELTEGSRKQPILFVKTVYRFCKLLFPLIYVCFLFAAGLNICLGKPVDNAVLQFIRQDVQLLSDSLNDYREEQDKIHVTIDLFKSVLDRAVVSIQQKQSVLEKTCEGLRDNQVLMKQEIMWTKTKRRCTGKRHRNWNASVDCWKTGAHLCKEIWRN